jgi:hypothetical protein
MESKTTISKEILSAVNSELLFVKQQNATLIENNEKLRNELSGLYEAYGSAVDITPELLQSVAETLKDTENGR